MRNPWVRLSMALGVAGCAAVACLCPGAMVSPGDVRQGHRQIAGDCLSCHAPFRGAPPERCVSCHPVDRIGLGASRATGAAETSKPKVPFHQHVQDDGCAGCHTEHRDSSFVGGDATFSHACLKPFVQRDCGKCHAMPRDAAHTGVVGACDGCHATAKWSPATTDHKKYFRLDPKHVTACATCHPGGDYRKYTCYGCHQHSLDRVEKKHQRVNVVNLDSCMQPQCHSRMAGDKVRGGPSRRGGPRPPPAGPRRGEGD